MSIRVNKRPLKILVTAGPTREPIDPVRYLGNRSSGRMGYALARAARARGHAVRLISGPVALPPPSGVRTIPVLTAADMLAAVRAHLRWCDVLIMAAAVADWRPVRVSPVKLKKAACPRRLLLEPTPDILQTIRPLKGQRLFVGFAAETGDPAAEGWRKLRAKGLDLLAANDVSRPDAGFEVDTNEVLLLDAAGGTTHLPLASKRRIAGAIIRRVERRKRAGEARPFPNRRNRPRS